MIEHKGEFAAIDLQVIEPAAPRSLLVLLATLELIDEGFPEIEDLPFAPVDL